VHIRKWFLSFCGFIVILHIAYFQDIFWAKLLPESFRPAWARKTNLPSHHHLKHFQRQRKSHKGLNKKQQFRQYSNNPLKKDINPKTNKILEVSTSFKDVKSFSHIFLNFATFTKPNKQNTLETNHVTKATMTRPTDAEIPRLQCSLEKHHLKILDVLDHVIVPLPDALLGSAELILLLGGERVCFVLFCQKKRFQHSLAS